MLVFSAALFACSDGVRFSGQRYKIAVGNLLSSGIGGVDGLSSAKKMAMIPDDKDIYVIESDDHSLFMFSVEKNTNDDVTKKFVMAFKDNVYVTAYTTLNSPAMGANNTAVVSVFSRDIQTGFLTSLQLITSIDVPHNTSNPQHYHLFTNVGDIAIDSYGKNVYVTNTQSNNDAIIVFTRNSDGMLKHAQTFNGTGTQNMEPQDSNEALTPLEQPMAIEVQS